MTDAGGNKTAVAAEKEKAVVRTPVSDRVEPRLRRILGGETGEVLLEAIRGLEAAAGEKLAGASVNAAAALKDSREAKAAADAAKSQACEAVSAACSAKTDAAAALEKAEAAAGAIDRLIFTAEDGTEVRGAQAFTAMLVQLQRNTGLLSEQLAAAEGIRAAAGAAASAAENAAAEARTATVAATHAKAEAEIAREQTATAAGIVQAAAEQHSQELGRIEQMYGELKSTVDGLSKALGTLAKGMATMKVSLRLIAKHAADNGVIPEHIATAIIEENSGGVG